MFSCSILGKKESCQPEVHSSQGPWRPEQSGGHYCRDPENWTGVLQGGPSPAMASFLFLLFLLLTPATVANLKTGGPCPACWGTAFNLESQRELLLDLAKKSILNKLHLRQRPTLNRPVSRAALKTALWRLRAPRQETPLEHDHTQEYEIISFAETGGSVVCSSDPKPDPGKRKSPPQLRSDGLSQAIQLLPHTGVLVPGSL